VPLIKVLVVILIGVVGLTSCSSGHAAHEFYVVVEPEEAARFIETVTAIAKEDGLETEVSRVVAGPGDVLWIVEGRGHGLRLWVQSTPQSGKEDPRLCGKYSKPHSDPAQFTVFTHSGFFGSQAGATGLGERVHSRLQKSGFEVRQKPAICGAAAIGDR
jgi:hypothetical protein